MNTCGRQARISRSSAAQSQQPRQLAQRLEESHDRQLVRIGQRLAAGRAHRSTGDTEDLSVRHARAQRLDERRAERIAASLPGDACATRSPLISGSGCAPKRR